MVETLVLLLVLGLVIFPIWAIVRIVSLSGRMDALTTQLDVMRRELALVRDKLGAAQRAPRDVAPVAAVPKAAEPPAVISAPAPRPETATSDIVTPAVPEQVAPTEPSAPPLEPTALPPAAPVEPPPLATPAEPSPAPDPEVPSTRAPAPWTILPPTPAAAMAETADGGLVSAGPGPEEPAPEPLAEPSAPAASPGVLGNVDWEQFTGAKLLAWVGGFAAFLALAFFVKYSFEHGWVSPELRAALGFLFGLGLVIGGLKIPRERYAVTAQTLIATGIVSLYAVTFACNTIYKFDVFRQHALLPFSLMVLITAAAFLLAVRLEARVVAILGILGGFLTPVLLATGEDNPIGLFTYIALLDLGLVMVALHRRWHFLVPLGAAGTILMQIGWAGKFFALAPEGKSTVAIVVSLAFSALFIGTCLWARRRDRSSPELLWSAIALPCVCFGFAIYFLDFPAIAPRLGLLFTFVLLADACLLTLGWLERQPRLVALAAGGTVLLLTLWLARVFTPERAPALMGITLGFGAGFLATHLIARRRERHSIETLWSAAAAPLLAFCFALVFLGHPSVAADVGRLFGFVLVAVLCLLALAWVESNPIFVALASAGPAVVEVGWIGGNLTPERTPAFMAILLGFALLFFAVHVVARRTGRAGPGTLWPAVALPFLALAFGFVFLNRPALAARPGLLFGFLLLVDAVLLALAWVEEQLPKLHLYAGVVLFALLATWTSSSLTASLLPWALAFYLLHAVLHTAYPLLLQRHRPEAAPSGWGQLFPPLTLLLMLGPLLKLDAVSLAFWPCVLLVDLLAIGIAVITASLIAVAVVLVLTLGVTGIWMFHLPVTVASSTSILVVIGGFAALFFGAGMFLARKFGDRLAGHRGQLPGILGDARASIPAFSALLPFLLLIMMTQRMPLANPSAIFGLALLLVVLVLGLARLLEIEWLPATGLLGVAALEYAWHVRLFTRDYAGTAVLWYVGFDAAFAVFPFIFRRRFAALTGPWVVAAAAAVLQFPLVYRVVRTAWPNEYLGVLPALFALPALASLFLVLRTEVASERARLNQLAWFGGVALLFITLIFPIQFDRQWLTLGWALEGAALLWLFHRVPHGGLRLTGVALLIAAFCRLALNPAVLEYHARSSVAILNWFLYGYGIVTVCLFAGARLLAPPRERVLGSNAPVLLNTLGTILAFLLLNIEIADFFSTPGMRVLTFQFSGNFGRDMTYTIGWALFAFGLLLVSIARDVRAGRYAALALLGVTVVKLFFHDLARLESLYRVGALFGVAVIAILASAAYQRFLPTHEKPVSDRP